MPPSAIAIIGAGFSGAMTAIHLARADTARPVVLIDPGARPGRGLAYGTPDPRHLLNVRAAGMAAFPDDPGHFHRWLLAHEPAWREAGMARADPATFAPRLAYGAYLEHLLREAMARHLALSLRRARIADLAPAPASEGGGYELRTGEDETLRAARVVLALGNFPPGEGEAGNPYDPALHARLAEPGDVLLVGAGLTALDLLVTLEATKREGRIHVMSRHGLFPRVHAVPRPYPPFLDPDGLPGTARALLRRVRREVALAASAGLAWQDVIDALRPLNQSIWRGLPPAERRRFLRHVRAYWDVHRHRCAPEILAARDRLTAVGRLVRHHGRFVAAVRDGDGLAVEWRPTGGGAAPPLRVREMALCTGPQSDPRRLGDPLVDQLLARGLVAPDPLRLGVDTDADGRLLDANGATVPGLYTIGSWRKGRLYESVAVPELRGQAAALADTILADTGAC